MGIHNLGKIFLVSPFVDSWYTCFNQASAHNISILRTMPKLPHYPFLSGAVMLVYSGSVCSKFVSE